MNSLNLNTKRHNNSIGRIVVVILILALALFICYVSYDDIQRMQQIKDQNNDIKELNKEIKELKSEKNKLNEQIEKYKKENTVENYYVSYSSLTKTEDKTTTLQLKGDGTFQMNVNNCNGVSNISGKYSKKDKKITLSEIENIPEGITGYDLKEITFDIEDKDLKVNNDLGCMYKDSLFTKNS